MRHVQNGMIRCPCVSSWLRPARGAGVVCARRAREAHRVAARPGGKPRRYAVPGGLLMMMLVLSSMAGRLPGARAAPAAPQGRVAVLRSPQPPAAATTFVWTVRDLSTGAAQHIMKLYLSGCWTARQIARVKITSGRLVRVDAHTGAITVDRLHNLARPLTITVRFKSRLRSAPTSAHLVLRRAGARHAIATLPVGGPACRGQRRVTRRPTPTPTQMTTPTQSPVPPTATTMAAPMATTTSPASVDPVVMAAGDIACDPSDPSYHNGNGIGTSCMQLATSNLLTTAVAVLPLGDEQYNTGALSAFQQVYEPTWGRYKSNTYPAVGNHEYQTPGAAGYYSYFGRAASPQDSNCTANCKGYYSYDLGAWHIVVLNSECIQVGGCVVGSAQEQWLKADLAAHANKCTLAYWHRPLFTSGVSSLGVSLDESAMHDFWVDLYNAHADLVLNAHAHIYERFAPQDASGNTDPTNGITEIVVGTGGGDHGGLGVIAAHSVVRDNTTFGVLKLTLHPTSFDWQFLPETAGGNGTFTDAGRQACHK